MSRLLSTIEELAGLASYLRDELPVPVSVGGGGRHSNTREYGHPAEWASDTSRRIADVLWWWHDYIAERRGLMRPAPQVHPATGRCRPEAAVTAAAVTAIRKNADWLLTTGAPVAFPDLEPPWLRAWSWMIDDEAFSELFELLRSVRTRAGHTKAREVLPLPCPNSECGMLALERVPGTVGQDFVVCGACGYTVKDRHYGFLVRLMLAQGTAAPQDAAAAGGAHRG